MPRRGSDYVHPALGGSIREETALKPSLKLWLGLVAIAVAVVVAFVKSPTMGGTLNKSPVTGGFSSASAASKVHVTVPKTIGEFQQLLRDLEAIDEEGPEPGSGDGSEAGSADGEGVIEAELDSYKNHLQENPDRSAQLKRLPTLLDNMQQYRKEATKLSTSIRVQAEDLRVRKQEFVTKMKELKRVIGSLSGTEAEMHDLDKKKELLRKEMTRIREFVAQQVCVCVLCV